MREFKAILFLLIFTFQLMPVKAIGKMLAKNTLTEEVKEDCCPTDSDENVNFADYLAPQEHTYFAAALKIVFLLPGVHPDDDLPNAHIKDIHCPPPNC